MANFKTHITASTLLGAGYGAAGCLALDAPLSTAMLAGGLCSVSGMLPDLDSDSGVPLRETIALTAAVTPLLMFDRFQRMGLTTESMVLAGGLIYIAIRFGVAEIFRRYTVHRGMWHSLPAAASVGLLAFLVVSCDDMVLRLFKSGAVVLGFVSHLLLDELYSVEWRGALPRLKKSFGTALKLWSKSRWANVSTYSKLLLLISLACGDPILMAQFNVPERPAAQTAKQILDDVLREGDRLLR